MANTIKVKCFSCSYTVEVVLPDKKNEVKKTTVLEMDEAKRPLVVYCKKCNKANVIEISDDLT